MEEEPSEPDDDGEDGDETDDQAKSDAEAENESLSLSNKPTTAIFESEGSVGVGDGSEYAVNGQATAHDDEVKFGEVEWGGTKRW